MNTYLLSVDTSDWVFRTRTLDGGAHAAILVVHGSPDTEASAGREAGLHLRDTLLVVEPDLQTVLVLLFRKPLEEGSTVNSIIEHGTGAFNIGGCRVGKVDGRWPANAIFIHDPRCKTEKEDGCHASCPMRILDMQSGITKSSDDPFRFQGTVKFKNMHYVREGDKTAAAMTNDLATAYGDEGGASRYFPCFTGLRPFLDWLVKLIAPPA